MTGHNLALGLRMFVRETEKSAGSTCRSGHEEIHTGRIGAISI